MSETEVLKRLQTLEDSIRPLGKLPEAIAQNTEATKALVDVIKTMVPIKLVVVLFLITLGAVGAVKGITIGEQALEKYIAK